jgi:hypothetical protein
VKNMLADKGAEEASASRITVNEITRNAVPSYGASARHDQPRPGVSGAPTRWVLVGFISPVLWRKLPGTRSFER